MKLTDKNKATIDAKSFEQLLSHNRFAPAGDPWFEGETGKHWLKRMADMKTRDPGAAVAASKSIGWD